MDTDEQTLSLEPLSDSPELRLQVQAAIDRMRPKVLADGGDLSLVGIEPAGVRVRLSGACTHCHLAGSTLGALRRELTQAIGRPVRVLPAPV